MVKAVLTNLQSVSNWGSTSATGRGLLALSGKGLIHQITLKTGEEYVVHPSHVIAYSMNQHVPQPYRFKANLLRFQIPNPASWLPDTRFWRTMRESTAWKFTRDVAYYLRTWTRRVIWGDRVRFRSQYTEHWAMLTLLSSSCISTAQPPSLCNLEEPH